MPRDSRIQQTDNAIHTDENRHESCVMNGAGYNRAAATKVGEILDNKHILLQSRQFGSPHSPQQSDAHANKRTNSGGAKI